MTKEQFVSRVIADKSTKEKPDSNPKDSVIASYVRENRTKYLRKQKRRVYA